MKTLKFLKIRSKDWTNNTSVKIRMSKCFTEKSTWSMILLRFMGCLRNLKHSYSRHFEYLHYKVIWTRVGKNLRNASLNLTLKFEIFWGFILKKPQTADLKKTQRINPQPQNSWPHPYLKFWGFLRIALKPKFLRILEKPWILSYFWAIFKGFFINFFEVFWGSSKNLKNLDLILTSSFEVYWGLSLINLIAQI